MDKKLEKTIKLLNSTAVPKTEIAEATDMSTRWLRDLAQGKNDNPGIKNLNAVYNYLITRQRRMA